MQQQPVLLNEDQHGKLINNRDSKDQAAVMLDRLLLKAGAILQQQGIKEPNEQSNGQLQDLSNHKTIRNSSHDTSSISLTDSWKEGYSSEIINWSSNSVSPSSQGQQPLNSQELQQQPKEWLEFEEFQTDKNIQCERQSTCLESQDNGEKNNNTVNMKQQQQQEQLAKTVANLTASLSQQQTENAQLHNTIQSLQDKQSKEQVNNQLSAMNQELKLNAMSQELVLMKTHMLSMKSMYVAKLKDQAMLVRALTARLKYEDKTRNDQVFQKQINHEDVNEQKEDQQLDMPAPQQQIQISQSIKQQSQNNLCQRVYQQLRSQQAKQQQQQQQQRSQIILSHPPEQQSHQISQQPPEQQCQYLAINFPCIEFQQQFLPLAHKSEVKETTTTTAIEDHHNNSIQSSSSLLSCNGSTQLNSQQQSINTQINSHSASQQLHTTATPAHQQSLLRIEETFKEELWQQSKEYKSQLSQTPQKPNQTASIHKAISNINSNREKKKLAISNNNSQATIISPTSTATAAIATSLNLLPVSPQHLLSSVIRRKTPRSITTTTTNTFDQQYPDQYRSSSAKQPPSQQNHSNTPNNNISILKKKRSQLLQQTLQLTYSPRNLHGGINQQLLGKSKDNNNKSEQQQFLINSPGNLSQRLMMLQNDGAASGSGSCTNRSISAGFNVNNSNKHSLKCLIAGGASGVPQMSKTSKNQSSNNPPENSNNNNSNSNNVSFLQHFFSPKTLNSPMMLFPQQQSQQISSNHQQQHACLPSNKHSFPDSAISQAKQPQQLVQQPQQPQPRQSLNNTHKIFSKLASPRGFNNKNHKQQQQSASSNHTSPMHMNEDIIKSQNSVDVTRNHQNYQHKSTYPKQTPKHFRQQLHIDDNINANDASWLLQQQQQQQKQLILSSLQMNTAMQRNITTNPGYSAINLESNTTPSHECLSGLITTTTNLSQQPMKETQEREEETNHHIVLLSHNKTKRTDVQSLHEKGKTSVNTQFLPIKKRYPARSTHSSQYQQEHQPPPSQHIYHSPPSQSLSAFTIDLSTQYPLSSNTTTVIPPASLNTTLVTSSVSAIPSSSHAHLTTKHANKRCVSAKPSNLQIIQLPFESLSGINNNTNKAEESSEFGLQSHLIQPEQVDSKGNKRVRTLKTNNFMLPENTNRLFAQTVVAASTSSPFTRNNSQRPCSSNISAGLPKSHTPVRSMEKSIPQQQFQSKNESKH